MNPSLPLVGLVRHGLIAWGFMHEALTALGGEQGVTCIGFWYPRDAKRYDCPYLQVPEIHFDFREWRLWYDLKVQNTLSFAEINCPFSFDKVLSFSPFFLSSF